MIVWAGRGITLFLVFVVVLAISSIIIPKPYFEYGIVLSFFVTGIYGWFFGNKWNNGEGRVFLDESTGQRVLIKGNHSLFWIPMQYWGIICSVFGLIILYQNSIIAGVVATIIFAGIILYFRHNKQQQENEDPQVQPEQNTSLRDREKEAEEEWLKRREEREDPSRFMPDSHLISRQNNLSS